MNSAAIEMAIENDWVNGKFEETETDYKISDTNILYKNEIEFLPKGVELLCKKLKPKSVLEFGFGMGWTATEFQKQGVQRHVILEPNKENYQMALEWKNKYNTDIEILNIFHWEYEPKEKFNLVYNDIEPFRPDNNPEKVEDWIRTHTEKIQWYSPLAVKNKEGIPDEPGFVFEIDGDRCIQSLRKI